MPGAVWITKPIDQDFLTTAWRRRRAGVASAADRGVYLREVYETLAPELADDAIALLKSNTITGPVAADLLLLLAQHTPPTPDLRQLYESMALSTDGALRTAAFELRGALDPNGSMQEILTGDLVGASLQAAAHRIVPGQLDDDVLCDGALHMLDSWPYEVEPALHSEGWWALRTVKDIVAARGDHLLRQPRTPHYPES